MRIELLSNGCFEITPETSFERGYLEERFDWGSSVLFLGNVRCLDNSPQVSSSEPSNYRVVLAPQE